MDQALADWPGQNYPETYIRSYRKAVLGFPMFVGGGFSRQPSRALLSELLPDFHGKVAHQERAGNRWPWERPRQSDPEIASRITSLVADGADPSLCLKAPQGHFMPLGVAAWLGLERTVDALIESGAAGTWPSSDSATMNDAEKRALLGDEDFRMNHKYRGIPLDPLSAATQALGVAVSLGYDEGELEGIIRITGRIGKIAPAFRADPGTGRTPIEELLSQLGQFNTDNKSLALAMADLLWSLAATHPSKEHLETFAQHEEPYLEGVAGQIPAFLRGPLKIRALEWHMGQTLKTDALAQAPSHNRRPSSRL